MSEPTHIPVLKTEVLDLLQPERGGLFLDGTLGLGGHSLALLKRAKEQGIVPPAIEIIGLDRDEAVLELAARRLGDQVKRLHGNFSDLASILEESGEERKMAGILLDLGVSSYQLDSAERGFSFSQDGPLDMRMDQSRPYTAANLINTLPEPRLAELFFRYGEERFSRRIARTIVEERRKQSIDRTSQLADLIYSCYPLALRHRRPHPATRVFQALRIEVNQELASLEKGLDAALSKLAPDGRLVVISFHSLEDRIVKLRFREAVAEGGFSLLTKKPIVATEEEIAENPRSRSAKLRAISLNVD